MLKHRAIAIALLFMLAVIGRAFVLRAQNHDHAPGMPMSHSAANADLHMEMSPLREATHADSATAASIAILLRAALAPYHDTTAAVKDGYVMFMPQVKEQKVYHFTNNWRAVQEAFRWDPTKPTSLLYKKAPDGQFILIGAMYTAPKRFGADKLDLRVPTSIARWHKHVNWCLPKKGAPDRWYERRDGQPVFGPESPIATKSACDGVDGVFHESIFGWMLHANVFVGDDPATIWGDEHAGQNMHAGMKMDVTP
jgi:hypothetical protein